MRGNSFPVMDGKGRVYKRYATLAKAKKIKTSTARWHMHKHGHLSNAGSGRGKHKNHAPPPLSMTVKIGGYEWPSIAALAREIGLKPKTAQEMIRKGRRVEIIDKIIEVKFRNPEIQD